jgi:hypothetical protein
MKDDATLGPFKERSSIADYRAGTIFYWTVRNFHRARAIAVEVQTAFVSSQKMQSS